MKISDVLKNTRLTEKSYMALEDNKYIFVVDPGASKDDVKMAVEKLFEVNVVAVKTINVRPKLKTGGKYKRTSYKTNKFKKAIVKLQEGQTIKLFDEIFKEDNK